MQLTPLEVTGLYDDWAKFEPGNERAAHLPQVSWELYRDIRHLLCTLDNAYQGDTKKFNGSKVKEMRDSLNQFAHNIIVNGGSVPNGFMGLVFNTIWVLDCIKSNVRDEQLSINYRQVTVECR